MSDNYSPLLPERNPVTYRAHRREVLIQITIPLVVGVVILIALMVLAALSSAPTASRWGDISLIWLIIPTMLFGMILLILTAAVAYGVVRLIQVVPGLFRKLQDLLNTVGAMVRMIDDKLVEPSLRIHSFWAGARAARRTLSRSTYRRP